MRKTFKNLALTTLVGISWLDHFEDFRKRLPSWRQPTATCQIWL